MKLHLICTELGKVPTELAGLEEGQIDWLYFGIVEKYQRQTEAMKGAESAVVYNSLDT